MTFRSVAGLLVVMLASMGTVQKAGAQGRGARPSTAPPSCVGGNLEGRLTLHASRSGTNFLSLCDGRTLPSASGGVGSR